MKQLLIYPLTLCLLCGIIYAQEATSDSPSGTEEYMEAGLEVWGIRTPYYDEHNRLQAQFYGGAARVLEDGVVDVTNIRIDVYDEGKVALTVYAPQCFAQVLEKGETKVLSVESDGDVLIEAEQMTITGRGFRFSSDGNRFEILTQAKVLINESARNIKGLNDV